MQRILTILLALCLLAPVAWGQTFVRAEFFINQDPGVGNGTVIPLNQPGATDVIDFTVAIPTAGLGLTPGFHQLCIRVLENNKGWSLYGKSLFLH
jgi:hypothetical protein